MHAALSHYCGHWLGLASHATVAYCSEQVRMCMWEARI